MAEKKVTTMVIKVDLGCEKCKKKIKKILCSIPQIQNQIYDEKANTVMITVVCCSTEKIKKKICCKGGDTIKGIEIKEPEKPKPKPDKVSVTEPQKGKPKDPEQERKPPVRTCCMECYGGHDGGPCWEGFGWPAPCYEGYWRPAPCYGAYGRPVYYCWGSGYSYVYGPCGRGCYVGRCDCLIEQNPSACSVM